MTLSEAIELIGNQNVRFQLLDTDAAGANRTKHGTKFTFFTKEAGPEYLLGDHEKLCLILWLPRNKWTEVVSPTPPQPEKEDV